MMYYLHQRLVELERRFANLILLSTIEHVDPKRAKVRVKRGDILSDWLPWLTQRAGEDCNYWAPSVGEQVLLISPQGDLNQGMVLPAIYQNKYAAPENTSDIACLHFADGATISYNRTQHQLSIYLPAQAQTQIKSEHLEITGDVTIHGNLNAQGDISDKTRSMHADRVIYNRHQHAGIKSGPSKTGTPKEQQ